ncbi:hypothetical protein Tco_1033531 [Tanacetum coccineum]
MNENKRIVPTKIELTLEQSQQGVSNDVLLKSDSLPHAHAQTTKTYYMHQDSRIKKAQELKTKTSANSDIKDNSSETKLRGILLESFQEDAKDLEIEDDVDKTMTKGSRPKIPQLDRKSLHFNKRQDSRLNDKAISTVHGKQDSRSHLRIRSDHKLGDCYSKKCLVKHGSSESAGSLASGKIVSRKILSRTRKLGY